jgi:hypothetical protein
VREIRTLRARWRELETEPRSLLNGHEGGNPGYSQASVLTGHRASSRPYQAALGEMWKHLALIGPHDRLPSRPPYQVLMLTNSF